jgi:hypothetical protein
MSRGKQRGGQRELPAAVKNQLRGSRVVERVVSQLRATVDVALFPALVAHLALFPKRGYSLLPSVGASLSSFRNDVPLFAPVSLERELYWAAAIFARSAKLIERFIDLKLQVERNLLLGRFDLCEELLGRLEEEFGFSFWLLEMRVAILQTSRGLEAQKAYCSSIRAVRRDGDLISFLAHFVSWRNEDTTNPIQFTKALSDKSVEWVLGGELRTYLLFKLTGQWASDDLTLCRILRSEASYSLVDYYETFVRLAIGRLAKGGNGLVSGFVRPLMSMASRILDPRLTKLLSLASADGLQHLDGCRIRSLASDDAVLGGGYAALKAKVALDVSESVDDIRSWYNISIAELDTGEPRGSPKPCGR